MSATPSTVPAVAAAPIIVKQEPLIIVEPGEAFQYYAHDVQSNGTSRKDLGGHPFRQYLRDDNLPPIVLGLARPLTLEEITALVYYDPDEEVCVACGKKFRPVAYYDVRNPAFVRLVTIDKVPIVEALKQLDGELLLFGCYYPNKNIECGYGAFCGCPWVWAKGAGTYHAASLSCLVRAHDNHPKKHWGLGRKVLDGVLARWDAEIAQAEADRLKRDKEAEEARKAEQARLARIADFFVDRGDKAAFRGSRRRHQTGK